MKKTLEILKKEVGGLSATSKMPGASWSISALRCKIGSKLRKIPGTTCSECYACKGRYTMPPVKAALERRYQAWLTNPFWSRTMAEIISRLRNPWFRWFDSGDLQGVKMMNDIAIVARGSPNHLHWLPTRETGILKEWINQGNSLPDNLLVRVSDMHIGQKDPETYVHTSGVKQRRFKKSWPALVVANKLGGEFHCPAPLQGNTCSDCRACWDPDIERVIYLEH